MSTPILRLDSIEAYKLHTKVFVDNHPGWMVTTPRGDLKFPGLFAAFDDKKLKLLQLNRLEITRC